MLTDSIIYFLWDLSATGIGRVRPSFLMALMRRVLDWNTQGLKVGTGPFDFDGFLGNISQRACISSKLWWNRSRLTK